MSKLLLIAAGFFVFFLVSCQKEISDFGPADPIPVDTLPRFLLSTEEGRYLEDPGIFPEQRYWAEYKYDTILRNFSYKIVVDDDIFGFDSSKMVLWYDSVSNWTKADHYYTNFGSIDYTNTFSRDLSGRPLRFDYSYRDFTGTIESFAATFRHQSLPNGGRRVTVIDTFYTQYQTYSYYHVDLDKDEKVTQIELLPEITGYHSWQRYYYTAGGQIQKIVDSSSSGPGNYLIFTKTYVQETVGNTALDFFTKSVKGKNFWWYMQGTNYSFNFLFDAGYVGHPLKEYTYKSESFVNNVSIGIYEAKYTLQNLFNTDGNLVESKVYRNGNLYSEHKYGYIKIR